MGYDHIEEEDAELMEAVERQVLAGLGIADPYDDHHDGDDPDTGPDMDPDMDPDTGPHTGAAPQEAPGPDHAAGNAPHR